MDNKKKFIKKIAYIAVFGTTCLWGWSAESMAEEGASDDLETIRRLLASGHEPEDPAPFITRPGRRYSDNIGGQTFGDREISPSAPMGSEGKDPVTSSRPPRGFDGAISDHPHKSRGDGAKRGESPIPRPNIPAQQQLVPPNPAAAGSTAPGAPAPAAINTPPAAPQNQAAAGPTTPAAPPLNNKRLGRPPVPPRKGPSATKAQVSAAPTPEAKNGGRAANNAAGKKQSNETPRADQPWSFDNPYGKVTASMPNIEKDVKRAQNRVDKLQREARALATQKSKKSEFKAKGTELAQANRHLSLLKEKLKEAKVRDAQQAALSAQAGAPAQVDASKTTASVGMPNETRDEDKSASSKTPAMAQTWSFDNPYGKVTASVPNIEKDVKRAQNRVDKLQREARALATQKSKKSEFNAKGTELAQANRHLSLLKEKLKEAKVRDAQQAALSTQAGAQPHGPAAHAVAQDQGHLQGTASAANVQDEGLQAAANGSAWAMHAGNLSGQSATKSKNAKKHFKELVRGLKTSDGQPVEVDFENADQGLMTNAYSAIQAAGDDHNQRMAALIGLMQAGAQKQQEELEDDEEDDEEEGSK